VWLARAWPKAFKDKNDTPRHSFHSLAFIDSFMRRYEPVSSAFLGGTVPSIFGTTLAPDKSLSAKLQKKKDDSCRYSSHHLSLYKSFCPTYLNLFLAELKNSSLTRTNRSFFGTCLIIDLSGFTRLSADLCDQGATGIDELRQIISLYFGSFVEIITSMGGDGMLNPLSFSLSYRY
jgi:hypothetical protein